jgi:hypothetical protein
MNEFWNTFFLSYGPAIVYALITAIAGLLAKGIAKAYNKYADTKEKREIAKIVVMAVEQIYKTLHGPEKFSKALDMVRTLLAERGIEISALEAQALIEAAVGEFNNVFEDTVEPLPEEQLPA